MKTTTTKTLKRGDLVSFTKLPSCTGLTLSENYRVLSVQDDVIHFAGENGVTWAKKSDIENDSEYNVLN